MEIEEYFKYRSALMELSKDENEFITESSFLYAALPGMFYAKLIDSEEINEAFCSLKKGRIKINAYAINESGERLQLFIVNERSVDLRCKKDELLVSDSKYYNACFEKCTRFVKATFKNTLFDELQDGSPVKGLVSFLNNVGGIEQIDVIEIFQISGSLTVSKKGASLKFKRIDFPNDKLKVKYKTTDGEQTKEVILIKRLVDVNFLFNVNASKGNREALVIDFDRVFNHQIEFIKAADEKHFESYLCVIPAKIIAGLYKIYSSRLLEKNVRSFLQFRGVNKGIRETIKTEPEKFIAYNNGLTITATDKKIKTKNGKAYLKSLTDFQIVNGGQTTATIYFSMKEGLDISAVNVMAKINVAKKASEKELDLLISNISSFSNAQNRVSRVDLRSRNPQLIKLKKLSESVFTPSGRKWFFERAKGEFYTLVRKSGKTQIKKEFPTSHRFSKEQMAKYYMAWGLQPHLVKKGGEKVFRLFIEEICGEDNDNNNEKKQIKIDRDFYESLIAKIILFRSLEKIYGRGQNSMGQLRSAVIPYSLAVLVKYTSVKKKEFDLEKVWKNETLEENLEMFFKRLLLLMNTLIKKYSKSEDYGEYSKRPELWDDIADSSEIIKFMNEPENVRILKSYSRKKGVE